MATKKMDRKLVALSQRHEVRYLFKRYPLIERDIILGIAKKSGRSRVKLNALLADYMYKNYVSKFLE